MLFHSRPIHHFIYVQEWAQKHQAKVQLDLSNFQLSVMLRNRYYDFFPQFVQRLDGRLSYSKTLNWQSTGFIGWLPYSLKQWPEAVSKLEFKASMQRMGQRIPQYWTADNGALKNVIIKANRGSFGVGIRGPYQTIGASNPVHQLVEAEFYEQFIVGNIIKAWFWNDSPICLEKRLTPVVEGNGVLTIRQLVIDTFNVKSPERLRAFNAQQGRMLDTLSFQALTWEDILPAGQKAYVDFLYGSCLFPDNDFTENKNLLHQGVDENFERSLKHLGNMLWSIIPKNTRNGVLYAVDGVLDMDGNCWWLEMNCNPMFPPDAYETMLNDLFKVE